LWGSFFYQQVKNNKNESFHRWSNPYKPLIHYHNTTIPTKSLLNNLILIKLKTTIISAKGRNLAEVHLIENM